MCVPSSVTHEFKAPAPALLVHSASPPPLVQFGVDVDRVASATRVLQRMAQGGEPKDVAMILDDGLQHFRMHRDLEVPLR